MTYGQQEGILGEYFNILYSILYKKRQYIYHNIKVRHRNAGKHYKNVKISSHNHSQHLLLYTLAEQLPSDLGGY